MQGAMTDRILFDLAPGFALGFDSEQWMIMKAKTVKGARQWRPVKFIGSDKLVLLAWLGRLGVTPNPRAAELLGQLPTAFLDWKAAGFPMPVAARLAA